MSASPPPSACHSLPRSHLSSFHSARPSHTSSLSLSRSSLSRRTHSTMDPPTTSSPEEKTCFLTKPFRRAKYRRSSLHSSMSHSAISRKYTERRSSAAMEAWAKLEEGDEEGEKISSAMAAVRAVGGVITAVRLPGSENAVRVVGPGGAGDEIVGDFGPILTFDEFFITPNTGPIPFPEPGVPLESLIYYLENPQLEDDDEPSFDGNESVSQPRHGIQVFIDSKIRIPVSVSTHTSTSPSSNSTLSSFQSITHVREASFSPTVQIGEVIGSQVSSLPPVMAADEGSDVGVAEGGVQKMGVEGGREGGRRKEGWWEGNSGATVRVVAGECGDVRAPPPLEDILLLDVVMRPSASVELPIPASYGALVYILEGVGLFGGSPNGTATGVTYQNEGHALWLPKMGSEENKRRGESSVWVRTHQWSHLRFILLGTQL